MMRRSIAILFLAAALAAPALAEDCLRTRLIDGFRDIDDHGLTLVDNRKNKWRAEFQATCARIKYAIGLVADSRGTCFEPGDAVIYTHNGIRDRCTVASLTRIEKDAATE